MNIGAVLPNYIKRQRGAVVVYKWLNVYTKNGEFSVHTRGQKWNGKWEGYKLQPDAIPTPDNQNGIYGCYNTNTLC